MHRDGLLYPRILREIFPCCRKLCGNFSRLYNDSSSPEAKLTLSKVTAKKASASEPILPTSEASLMCHHCSSLNNWLSPHTCSGIWAWYQRMCFCAPLILNIEGPHKSAAFESEESWIIYFVKSPVSKDLCDRFAINNHKKITTTARGEEPRLLKGPGNLEYLAFYRGVVLLDWREEVWSCNCNFPAVLAAAVWASFTIAIFLRNEVVNTLSWLVGTEASACSYMGSLSTLLDCLDDCSKSSTSSWSSHTNFSFGVRNFLNGSIISRNCA